MDRWLVVFALGGWFCFMASAVVAMWKWKQLAEAHDVEMEHQRIQTLKANEDVKMWQKKYSGLIKRAEIAGMVDGDVAEIMTGGGGDYYNG